MKRFLLFGYNDHYPFGGGNDYLCSCDTLEEARANGPKPGGPRYALDRYHVFDTELEQVVFRCMGTGESEDGDD